MASITVPCPSCGKKLSAPPQAAGKKATCPKCKAPVVIPIPPSEAPTMELRLAPGQLDAMAAERVGFRCPHCHSTDPPTTVRKMSQNGLIVLIVMVFVCFPLFWIGLLMQEDQRVCSTCGAKLSS